MSRKPGAISRMTAPEVEYMIKVWGENLYELDSAIGHARYWSGVAIQSGSQSRIERLGDLVWSLGRNIRFLKARIAAGEWCLKYGCIEHFRFAYRYFLKPEDRQRAFLRFTLWQWREGRAMMIPLARTGPVATLAPIVTFAFAMASSKHYGAT